MKRSYPQPEIRLLTHDHDLDIRRPCDRCGVVTSIWESVRDYEHTFCSCWPCFQLTHPRMYMEMCDAELLDGEFVQ